jgi:hypothetical protein
MSTPNAKMNLPAERMKLLAECDKNADVMKLKEEIAK